MKELLSGVEDFSLNLNVARSSISFKTDTIPLKGLKSLRKKERVAWCGLAFNKTTLTVFDI